MRLSTSSGWCPESRDDSARPYTRVEPRFAESELDATPSWTMTRLHFALHAVELDPQVNTIRTPPLLACARWASCNLQQKLSLALRTRRTCERC